MGKSRDCHLFSNLEKIDRFIYICMYESHWSKQTLFLERIEQRKACMHAWIFKYERRTRNITKGVS